MIKHLCIVIAILSISLSARADTFKSETEAKQLSEKVMAQVAKGELAAAFSLMKPYVIIPDSEFQSLALQSKAQRDQFGARLGKSIGYELVSERKAGDSILRLIYVEKTTKHALPWVFIFYKSPTGWILNDFAWNDRIQNAFEQ